MLNPLIRTEHILKYGLTDAVEAYLQALETATTVSKTDNGENHHMLARSVWPQYANFTRHPWNILRVSRATHVELTELQDGIKHEFTGLLFIPAGKKNGTTSTPAPVTA